MKREKTVVDVEVSEDKKKEIIGSLLREHTTFGMGFERERKRQEENVSRVKNEMNLLTNYNIRFEIIPVSWRWVTILGHSTLLSSSDHWTSYEEEIYRGRSCRKYYWFRRAAKNDGGTKTQGLLKRFIVQLVCFLCICLCLFACLSVFPFVCLSVCMLVSACFCVSVCFCLSVHVSLYLFVCLFVCVPCAL